MVFAPNTARTLKLPVNTAAFPNLILQFPAKSPYQTLDYTLDVTKMLAADGIELISQASCAVFGADNVLTVTQPVPGPLLTVMVSGGTLNTAYALRFRFVTNSVPPRIYSYDTWIDCVNLASRAQTIAYAGVGPQGLMQEAPQDGQIYGRRNGQWTIVGSPVIVIGVHPVDGSGRYLVDGSGRTISTS